MTIDTATLLGLITERDNTLKEQILDLKTRVDIILYGGTHTIKDGDTISSIAAQYYLSFSDILYANKDFFDNLKVEYPDEFSKISPDDGDTGVVYKLPSGSVGDEIDIPGFPVDSQFFANRLVFAKKVIEQMQALELQLEDNEVEYFYVSYQDTLYGEV